MAQKLDIPLVSPFKFYKDTATPGIHFDDDWYYNRIKSFEVKKQYFQKWEKQNVTPFLIVSTIQPSKVVVRNLKGLPVGDFLWTAIGPAGIAGEMAYICTVDFTAFAINQYWKDNVYHLSFEAQLLSIDWPYISEPIWLKAQGGWPETKLLQYWDDGNIQAPFTLGYKPYFRVEMGITDFQPGRERASFTDQLHDVETLSAMPYREYKLSVGHKDGVAPWVMDLMNRIYCCKYVVTEGLQYETIDNSKWDISRQKGYPLIWGSIEVTEAVNVLNLEDNAESIYPGIITGYNYKTNFFGGAGNVIGVQDVEIIN